MMRFLSLFASLLLCNVLFIKTYGQYYSEDVDKIEDSIPSVTEFEKYNKILGGDSIRYCNGYPCKGWIKDVYSNQNLKHHGFYVDGRLESVYKNYYENGQLEREFTLHNYKKSTMNIFYPDGKKLSEIEYFFTDPISWTDYYPNGQIEYAEIYHNSGEYILSRYFYYENGQIQSSFLLLNKKENLFEMNEFYPDGKLKEKGTMIYNKSLGDYQKTGKWLYYKENGELSSKENYYKNKIVDESEVEDSVDE